MKLLRIYDAVKRKVVKRFTKDETNRNAEAIDRMVEEKFEKCVRYRRRGIVISRSADQMQSIVIQPDTREILLFRISVYGEII